ncbi:MAG: hypothetical protein ACP5H7_01140 [Minisyncoccia bacterium]
MRKFLILSILSFLLILLILPLILKADIPQHYECCKLRTDVSLGKIEVNNNKEKMFCAKDSSVGTAADITKCGTACTGGNLWSPTVSWGLFCLIDSIQYTTNWIFYILTIIVVVMAIWGAATIITSAGNPDSMTKGKQILTYALIGLVLALVAKLLPSIVQFIVIKT